MVATWQFICQRVPELFQASFAASTKKQYARHARYWVMFARVFGFDPLEPSDRAVTAFVIFLSQTQQYRSITSTMTGVKQFWKDTGFQLSSMDQWRAYPRVMQGLRRHQKGPPQRKHPISPDELSQMQPFFRQAPFANALWACIIISWWSMLRKSNTTSEALQLQRGDHCITRADVSVDLTKWRLTVRVRSSKTNQYKERCHEIVLQGKRGHVLDPVAAWTNHIASSTLPEAFPAFAFEENGKPLPMRYDDLRCALKVLMAAIGGNAAAVSSHSLRRGGATFAYHAGVRDVLIQAHGDWRSDAYKAYIDFAPSLRLRASELMFAHIESGQPAPMYPAIDPMQHLIPVHEQEQMAQADEPALDAAMGPDVDRGLLDWLHADPEFLRSLLADDEYQVVIPPPSPAGASGSRDVVMRP